MDLSPAPRHRLSWLFRIARWLTPLAAIWLVGCGSLPRDVARPASHALPSPAGTLLGRTVREQTPAGTSPRASGLRLIASAGNAYASRMALARVAQKTLDIQYYAIHVDETTRPLLQAIRDAAARGVRVRILLDDLHATGNNTEVLRLALVPNIEVRLFNPLPGSRSLPVLRMFGALSNFSRLQRRMHNKIFVSDNALAVIGGRNLGETYFGRGDASHFVDIDLLAAGPVVQELSGSFDRYWNSSLAYPVQSLISEDDLRAPPSAPSSPISSASAAPPPEGNFDLQHLNLTWAPALMLADHPEKIDPEQDTGERDTLVDGLLGLVGQARSDVLIVSPYFVPGPQMMGAFERLRAAHVRIRVLTNSLASNDAPIAHVGYARYRQALLAMGVELYEMHAEQRQRLRALGSTGTSQQASLHSKLVIVDHRLLVVGSMNLDLRSQLQNTEVALVVASRALASRAEDIIEPTLQDGSYRLDLDNGRLIWNDPETGQALHGGEPDASLPLQWILKLLGPLAPDEML